MPLRIDRRDRKLHCLGQQRPIEIADTDVADLAGTDGGVESRDLFPQCYGFAWPVQQQKIDVVSA